MPCVSHLIFSLEVKVLLHLVRGPSRTSVSSISAKDPNTDVAEEEPDVRCARFSNMPYIVGMSVDLDNDVENVDMALTLPVGAEPEEVQCTESPNGLDAVISFDWPKSLYDIEELYDEEVKAHERIDSTIQSLKEELKYRRSQVGIAPRAQIIIPLPTPVQTDYVTWVRKGKRGRDGAVIIKAKFRAHRKAYNIDDGKRAIKFPKIEGN